MAARAKEFALRAEPYTKKLWKTYSFQRGLKEQTLSPFELNVTGGLLKTAFEKTRFKIQDNIWYWGPTTLAFGAMLAYVGKLRKDFVHSHRS